MVLRFNRLVFGLKPSPALLAATLKVHFESYPGPLTAEIEKDLYVDNVHMSAATPSEGRQKSTQAKAIFSAANMHPWDKAKDELIINLPRPPESDQLTKRVVLQELASNFDPLGLIAPALLASKLFFQSLWRKNLDWDDPLTTVDVQDWSKISQKLGTEFNIPRMVKIGVSSTIHVFCDASEKAIATCIYVRDQNSGQPSCSLVFSKIKVVPEKDIKKANIHRLELVAASQAVKCLAFVRKHLSMENTLAYLWTDSGTVVSWLHNCGLKHDIFVKNRIMAIQKTENLTVKYVNTEVNPADIGSRGMEPARLVEARSWWNGPDFLKNEEKSWPSNLQIPDFSTRDPVFALSLQKIALSVVIHPSDFSDWSRLLKVTAIVLRFARKLLERLKDRGSSLIRELAPIKENSLIISAKELQIAKNYHIKHAQQDFF
uniref:Pao retrotransposon peptidase n=1 Tax=Ditylenchus dipsaci TaxID=166011 RepID=A0A915DPD7_9BILA